MADRLEHNDAVPEELLSGMSRWPSTQASRVLSALLRIDWQIERSTGSHRVLQRTG